MSRLNDRISAAIEAARDETGRVDLHVAIGAVKPTLTDEDKERLIDDSLHRRAKTCATRGRAELKARASQSQADLPFELQAAYALDLDGRYVKQTIDLTRVEVRRLIQIREEQATADAVHLNELKRAEREAGPIWDAHPDWVFGQVLNAVVQRALKAA